MLDSTPTTTVMSRTKRRVAVLLMASTGLLLAGASTAAFAVSGGGFNPDQQGCPWSADASNSFGPSSATPGCHNAALNVESGGTTNGDPNSNNTRFASVGLDQSPNYEGNPSFGTLYNLGDPGTPGAVHGGCVALNTDGTNGGTGSGADGCGSNSAGTGVSSTFDYYQVYCPATNALPVPLSTVPWVHRGAIPDPSNGALPLDPPGLPALYNCDPNQPYGQNGLTTNTGQDQKLTDIASNGLLVYYGMDDNNDNGEHDGYSANECQAGDAKCDAGSAAQAVNGPSDGGAVMLSLTPQSATNAPTGHNPQGVANASTGFCADGICTETTTQQQTVYYGCDNGQPTNSSSPGHAKCDPKTAASQDIYRNSSPASTKEKPGCQSGDPTVPADCFTNADGSKNPGGPNTYVEDTPHQMNAEPGFQTYQDPDPQRSPAAPFGTPGTYVGTCGIYANDGTSSVGPSAYDYARSQGLPTPPLPTKGANGTIIDQPSGLC